MKKKGEKSGTMYVVSVSGPKMTDSGTETKFWMDKDATYTQLYQVISILNDKLEFRSYKVTGELFDAFDLVKQKGTINKLVDKMPEITN